MDNMAIPAQPPMIRTTIFQYDQNPCIIVDGKVMPLTVFTPAPMERRYFVQIAGTTYWVKPILAKEALEWPILGEGGVDKVHYVLASLNQHLALERERNEELEAELLQLKAKIEEMEQNEASMREETDRLAVCLFGEMEARTLLTERLQLLEGQSHLPVDAMQKIDLGQFTLLDENSTIRRPVDGGIEHQHMVHYGNPFSSGLIETHLRHLDGQAFPGSSTFSAPRILPFDPLAPSPSYLYHNINGDVRQEIYGEINRDDRGHHDDKDPNLGQHHHHHSQADAIVDHHQEPPQPHLSYAAAAAATSTRATGSHDQESGRHPLPSASHSSALEPSSSHAISADPVELSPQDWLSAQGLNWRSQAAAAVMLAATKGLAPVLKWLKAQGVAVETITGADGRRALYWAVIKAKMEAIEYLLALGADVTFNMSQDHGLVFNCGHQAALWGHLKVVKWITTRAKLTVPSATSGATLIHSAATGGHLDVLKWLTNSLRLSLHAKRKDMYNVAHLAAEKGHIHCLQWFLEQRVDMLALTKDNLTPSDCASIAGQPETVEWFGQQKLILARPIASSSSHASSSAYTSSSSVANASSSMSASGTAAAASSSAPASSDPSLAMGPEEWLLTNCPEWKTTPIMAALIAAAKGATSVLRWLYAVHGIPIHRTQSDGSSPLRNAVSKARHESIEYLLSINADAPFKASTDFNILSNCAFTAANKGHLTALKWLMSKADIRAPSKSKATLIHAAASGGHVEVIKWLVDFGGMDLHAKKQGEYNAAHLAAEKGHLPMLRYLKSQQVDMSAVAAGSATPHRLAKLAGHTAVVQWFQNGMPPA